MAIDYHISVRASWEELRELSPEQCAAFMEGVAQVLSANPHLEESALAEPDDEVIE